MAVLDIRDRPNLRRPLMLAGFGGWGDAGSGATSAIGYLVGDDSSPIAVLDPEACFDFTVQRPITARTPNGRWTLRYPEIRFHAIQRPDHDRDLVVLTGPEPHMRWPTLTRATAEFAKEMGVETVITLGVFLGSVSHRARAMVRRTLDLDLDERLAALDCVDTGYQGPTGFVTALLHSFDGVGIPAASVWSAAPIYLRAVNPAVALGLLETVERAVNIRLDLEGLRDRANAFIREVDAMLASNPELANQLGSLIDLGPSGDGDDSSAQGSQELPSAQSLVEELERFLREARGEDEESVP